MLKIFKNFDRDFTVLLNILSGCCVLLFGAALYEASFLAVYPDEILWKVFDSRFFLDGGKLVYAFPQCHSSFLASPPLTWFPAILTDSLMYQDLSHPMKNRFYGIVGFILLIAVLVGALKKFTRLNLVNRTAVALSFFSVGTLPFLMQLNRPEKSLLFYMGLGLLVPFLVKEPPTKTVSCFGWTVFYLLLCVFSFSAHPMGIILILPLLTAHFFLLRSWLYSFAISIPVFFSVFETLRFWNLRSSCVESPWVVRVLASASLSPGMLFQQPAEFFKKGFENWSRVGDFFSNSHFQVAYQNSWLPGAHLIVSRFENVLNHLVYVPFVGAGLALILLVLCVPRVDNKTRSVVLVLTVGLTLLAVTFFLNEHNFYNSGLVLPLLALVFVFSLSVFSIDKESVAFEVIMTFVILSANLQLGNLVIRFFPLVNSEWKPQVLEENEIRKAVKSLAFGPCGFSPGETLKNLVVDLHTYPVLWESYAPMFDHSVFGWWSSGVSYKETLGYWHSEGIVAACSSLPPEIVSIANKEKGYCCLKDPIKKLHISGEAR